MLSNRYGMNLELGNSGMVGVSNWWKDICNLDVAEIDTLNEYSVKEVYKSLSLNGQSAPTHSWYKVWNRAIPLKVSCMLWRLLSNIISKKDNLAKRVELMLGQLWCFGECGSEESVSHTFFECPFFADAWSHICKWFDDVYAFYNVGW